MTHVAATGIARIRHAESGEIFEIDAEELDFDAIGADERGMGPEVHHQADMDHPELGLLVWGLWEYPIGIENMTETDVGRHELLADISYGLEHEPDFDEPPDEEPGLGAMLRRLPAQLAALDTLLNRMSQPHGLMGHNGPPAVLQPKLGEDDVARLRDSIVDLQNELAKPDAATTADPAKLSEARDRFTSLSRRLLGAGRWAGPVIGTGVLAGLGKGIGEQAWAEAPVLHVLLHSIVDTLSVWIHAVATLL